MSGGLGNVRRSLDNVCGSPAEVCGGLGKVVYCEVYKNLTKAMKLFNGKDEKLNILHRKCFGKGVRKFRQCAPFFGRCLRKSCTGVRRFGRDDLLRSL